MSRQLYARVFLQILDSSIAEDFQVRHVFEDFLKLADDGIVDMTREALVRRLNIPRDVLDKAISVLEQPDPASRDPEADGRRIAPLDAHRSWGWSVLNWEKYEAIRSTQDQREQARNRKRRQRERDKSPPPPPPTKTTDSDSDSEAEAPGQNVTVTKCHVMSRRERDTKRSAVASPTSVEDFESWISSLKSNPAYAGIDVARELAKMQAWCAENRKEPTRRRFVNWLNRADRPVLANGTPAGRPQQPSRLPTDYTKGF